MIGDGTAAQQPPAMPATPAEEPTPLVDRRHLVVEITLRDVWMALQEVKSSVHGVPAAQHDHETRLRALERRVWWASGIAAAVGAIGTNLLDKI